MLDPQRLAERCAEVMYAADRASQTLGITIEQVQPGRAVARMTVTDIMINGHEICHGGYVFTLADSAFAFACNTYDAVTVAAACDVAFLAPARLGDELVAEATERVRQARTGVYDVTVRRWADGQVVAEFRGHSRVIRGSLLSLDSAGGQPAAAAGGQPAAAAGSAAAEATSAAVPPEPEV